MKITKSIQTLTWLLFLLLFLQLKLFSESFTFHEGVLVSKNMNEIVLGGANPITLRIDVSTRRILNNKLGFRSAKKLSLNKSYIVAKCVNKVIREFLDIDFEGDEPSSYEGKIIFMRITRNKKILYHRSITDRDFSIDAVFKKNNVIRIYFWNEYLAYLKQENLFNLKSHKVNFKKNDKDMKITGSIDNGYSLEIDQSEFKESEKISLQIEVESEGNNKITLSNSIKYDSNPSNFRLYDTIQWVSTSYSPKRFSSEAVGVMAQFPKINFRGWLRLLNNISFGVTGNTVPLGAGGETSVGIGIALILFDGVFHIGYGYSFDFGRDDKPRRFYLFCGTSLKGIWGKISKVIK